MVIWLIPWHPSGDLPASSLCLCTAFDTMKASYSVTIGLLVASDVQHVRPARLKTKRWRRSLHPDGAMRCPSGTDVIAAGSL